MNNKLLQQREKKYWEQETSGRWDDEYSKGFQSEECTCYWKKDKQSQECVLEILIWDHLDVFLIVSETKTGLFLEMV